MQKRIACLIGVAIVSCSLLAACDANEDKAVGRARAELLESSERVRSEVSANGKRAGIGLGFIGGAVGLGHKGRGEARTDQAYESVVGVGGLARGRSVSSARHAAPKVAELSSVWQFEELR